MHKFIFPGQFHKADPKWKRKFYVNKWNRKESPKVKAILFNFHNGYSHHFGGYRTENSDHQFFNPK